MTRQLLAFSRQQVLEPCIVDLNEVLASTENMLRRLIGEDVQLETLPSETSARVFVDPGQIEQVLMNLVVNARDAMPNGGRLAIDLACVDLSAAKAAEVGLRPGRFVSIVVADTGCGMDAATRTRVFEPFFTTKAPGKGTGLGLSTVFGIVQQSGGQVALESEPGRGTTFRIWLPFAAGALSQASMMPASAEGHGSETILLVEDDDSVRKVTRMVLAKHGYRVLEARSGGDALVMCEERTGPIDLVLTDMVMPLMSGEQMVARLRALRPAIRVAFMSGYPDKGLAPGTAPSPESFIQKPFTPETLLRRIRDVLASASPGAASAP